MTKGNVIVGKIVRSHGLSGDLKVQPLTDNPDRFGPGKKVLVQFRDQEFEVVVDRVRPLRDHLLIAFTEYGSRSQVEPWVGGWILVPEDELPDLPDGQYYHFQIVGMQVFDQESGEPLGEIAEILSTGSNDVYVVRSGDKERLIPATQEIIQEIDIRQNRMMVSRVEDLIE